jgi:hypothetical protein
MAASDKYINQLTPLPAAQLDVADILPIFDVSESKNTATKGITVAELAAKIGGGGGGPTVSGATNLDALTDVDTTTTAPVLGDNLEFDGTKWIPKAETTTTEVLKIRDTTNAVASEMTVDVGNTLLFTSPDNSVGIVSKPLTKEIHLTAPAPNIQFAAPVVANGGAGGAVDFRGGAGQNGSGTAIEHPTTLPMTIPTGGRYVQFNLQMDLEGSQDLTWLVQNNKFLNQRGAFQVEILVDGTQVYQAGDTVGIFEWAQAAIPITVTTPFILVAAGARTASVRIKCTYADGGIRTAGVDGATTGNETKFYNGEFRLSAQWLA